MSPLHDLLQGAALYLEVGAIEICWFECVGPHVDGPMPRIDCNAKYGTQILQGDNTIYECVWNPRNLFVALRFLCHVFRSILTDVVIDDAEKPVEPECFLLVLNEPQRLRRACADSL